MASESNNIYDPDNYFFMVKTTKNIGVGSKRKKEKINLHTINQNNKKYHFHRNRTNSKPVKNYFSNKIIDIDRYNISSLQPGVYTWIIKYSIDEPDTVSMYMTKLLSQQEIGTLHRNLAHLHRRKVNDRREIMGAGELKVISPTEIKFNLLSGTYMKDIILKNKSNNDKKEITDNIITKVVDKLQKLGINATYTNEALIDVGIISSKENIEILQRYFINKYPRNNTKEPNLQKRKIGSSRKTIKKKKN